MEHAVLVQRDRWLGEVREAAEERAVCDILTVVAHTIGRLALLLKSEYLHTTHAELGDLTGVYRSKVTEATTTLARLGLIEHVPHEHGFRIPDAAALRHFGSAPT